MTENNSERILTVLMDRPGEDLSVAQVAEATGINRRSVAVTLSNLPARRRATGSDNPLTHVHRTRRGWYRYDPEYQPSDQGASDPCDWTQVGSEDDRFILRGPDGQLYVATRLGALLTG